MVFVSDTFVYLIGALNFVICVAAIVLAALALDSSGNNSDVIVHVVSSLCYPWVHHKSHQVVLKFFRTTSEVFRDSWCMINFLND